MTGSLRITGSLNTIGNACATSICSPTFIGGTISGTTIYGSTAICAPSILSSGTICSTSNTCFGGNNIIAGCVGIGIATPSGNGVGGSPTVLNVHKAGTDAAVLSLSNTGTAQDVAVGVVNFAAASLSDGDKRLAEIAALKANNCTNTAAGNLLFYTSNNAGLTEKMRITNGGFVGVGCTDPKYTLDVCGLVNINGVATTCQGTVQTLRVSSNTGDAAVTINSCSINRYTYLTFAQGCAAKFEIGVASCGDPSFPSNLYISNNTQVGAANAAIRITSTGITSFQCQVCVPSMTALTARTSGTDVNILTLADNVSGVQTSGFGVRILASSNGGAARSAIGFEANGGTNNDTAISFYTQASAACLAHRMIIDKEGQVAIGSKSTVSGIKLLVCGGGDYNTLFTSDTNRSGWTIAQPGTSSPIASGLVLAGSCSFRFGTNSYYHLVMNQDGSTQVFNTAGNGTNTFMPSGLLCTLCGVKFGNGSGTLNYYEVGSWTPRVSAGSWTTNPGGDNAGWYVRVGNIVTVGGTVSWSGGSGSQNNVLIIGCLPFTSNGGAHYRSVGQFGAPAAGSIGFKNQCAQMVLVTDPSQSSIYIIENYMSGTTLTYTHNTCIANAGTIYGFQITYQI